MAGNIDPTYVQCPSTPKEWKDIAQEFWEGWNFPLCIGPYMGNMETNFIPGGWRKEAGNDTGYYPAGAGRNRNPCKKAAKEIRDMLKDYNLIYLASTYHKEFLKVVPY
eukprot:gene16064-7412_t